MKIGTGLRGRRRELIDAVLVGAGIVGLLLVNGFACYHLRDVMSDVSSSVALLATIGR
jgi:hypothetical protein